MRWLHLLQVDLVRSRRLDLWWSCQQQLTKSGSLKHILLLRAASTALCPGLWTSTRRRSRFSRTKRCRKTVIVSILLCRRKYNLIIRQSNEINESRTEETHQSKDMFHMKPEKIDNVLIFFDNVQLKCLHHRAISLTVFTESPAGAERQRPRLSLDSGCTLKNGNYVILQRRTKLTQLDKLLKLV